MPPADHLRLAPAWKEPAQRTDQRIPPLRAQGGTNQSDQPMDDGRVAPGHRCPAGPSEPGCGFHRTGLKQAREDALPQTPYVVFDPLPVDRQPVEIVVLRSVHHGDAVASNVPIGSGVVGHRLPNRPT